MQSLTVQSEFDKLDAGVERMLANSPESKAAFDGLDDNTKQAVMLAAQQIYRVPPLTRMTLPGDEDYGYAGNIPSLKLKETGQLDFDKVDKMMATGQIAYSWALKKAPITAIVRSSSGFAVESADEKLADLMHKNLQIVLSKRIDEILTFLVYGAYYSEVTYTIGWPQDYGLPRSVIPYWVLDDLNGCHPTTIDRILRDDKTNEFRGFVQIPPGKFAFDEIKVGPERALLIPNNGEFGNLEGTSILEPIHTWWFWYELVWRSFLRFLQRQSTGVVIVKAPQSGRVQVGDSYVDSMQWALQMASSMHRTNYAAVPSDADENGKELWVVDVKSMGSTEGRQYLAAVENLLANIQSFMLTGERGSGEEGEFEVMLDTERILAHIAMYFNEYVLPKYLMWNGSRTRVATLNFQGANSRILPLFFKLLAVAGNTVGDALRNVDWRTLMGKGGVPVLTEEEVEELRQKQMEEQAAKFKQAQEQMQDGEKAKGQPDGEGRWASQRDKEGKPEKMEALGAAMESASMIKEALNTPLLALTAPQVALLEELGLRVSTDTINLYNPYHDKSGLFTDKAHATSPLPDEKLQVHGKVSDRAGFRAQDAASLAYERVGQQPATVNVYQKRADYVRAVCGTDRACAVKAGRTYGIYKDGELHIGPAGVKSLERDRKFGEYILTHEAYHNRKRADGGTGADLSFQQVKNFRRNDDYKTAYARFQLEEGTTDILARNAHGVNHKYWTSEKLLGRPYYVEQMGAIAFAVGKASGWNRSVAWDMINGIHHNINNDSFIQDILDRAVGTPRGGWSPSAYFVTIGKLRRAARWQDYKALKWLFGGGRDERGL